MNIDLEPKPVAKIETAPVLQQTSYWGQVKKIQGWSSHGYNLKLKISDNEASENAEELLVVSRKIGQNAEIAYIPYGPNLLPNQINRGQYLEELSEKLRNQLSKNCILIRYDLPWSSPWMEETDCYDESGKWLGPPEPRIREFRMNFGTREWNLKKAPTDILPSSTLFIDLRKTKGELMAKMKPKTRYNINLSRRKGVIVRDAGCEEIPVWYDMYCQTAIRNKITLHHQEYFNSLIEAKKKAPQKDTRVHLLIAEINQKPIAGMFLVIAGKKATYLYGASSNDSRNFMSTYLLQWEAVCKAKEAGCVQYDMFGVSQQPDPNHPMFGLYRFKSGFGGQFFHRQGCWDYPLSEKKYSEYISSEISSIGYHL